MKKLVEYQFALNHRLASVFFCSHRLLRSLSSSKYTPFPDSGYQTIGLVHFPEEKKFPTRDMLETLVECSLNCGAALMACLRLSA